MRRPYRSSTPTFLVIGHLARDAVSGGYRPGGTALYASLAAHRLGERVAVVTSAGAELDYSSFLAGVEVLCHPSPTTTTFANRYLPGGRIQHLHARAEPLTLAQVPSAWRGVPVVLLGPLAQEVDSELAGAFPGALTGATAQGWLRAWDEEGRVRRAGWAAASAVLPHLQALILSEEDVEGDWGLLEAYAQQTAVLVVTQGAAGATVFWCGRRRSLPAYPATVVDPTGAGDVFAAAFLVELARTADPFQSVVFANAAASFVVERPGVEGIPTGEQVRERMRGWL